MEISAIASALVLALLCVHLAVHSSPPRGRRGAVRRRLSRLGGAAAPSTAAGAPDGRPWHATLDRRAYVPAGLRLAQARRVLRNPPSSDNEDG